MNASARVSSEESFAVVGGAVGGVIGGSGEVLLVMSTVVVGGAVGAIMGGVVGEGSA